MSYTIIGLSCFAVLFTLVAKEIFFRLKIKRWKPFDCPMCFGFWTGFWYFTIHDHLLFFAVLYAAIVSILSIYIEKLIRP